LIRSVAALLLKKQGYDVVGVFMRCYNLDGCSERDAEDARRVAEHIGIPFYVWDFEDEYKERVVKYMVMATARGSRPNPDVMCNKRSSSDCSMRKRSPWARTTSRPDITCGSAGRPREGEGRAFKKYFLREAKDKHKDHPISYGHSPEISSNIVCSRSAII